jgi:hypothetical protein
MFVLCDDVGVREKESESVEQKRVRECVLLLSFLLYWGRRNKDDYRIVAGADDIASGSAQSRPRSYAGKELDHSNGRETCSI